MRLLTQSAVLKQAVLAAVLSTLAAWPRLAGFSENPNPMWFLAGGLFWAAFCLWAAVFAWQARGPEQALFRWRLGARAWGKVTLVGVVGAVLFAYTTDPVWRLVRPRDFPVSTTAWAAQTLFYLGFEQLFTYLGPFALLLRLTGSARVSIAGVALFRLGLLGLQLHGVVSAPSVAGVLLLSIARVAVTWVVLNVYLRGGLLPVCWLGILWQLRHWFFLEAGR